MRTSPNKLGFDVATGFKITEHLKGGERLPQVAALLELLESQVPEPAATGAQPGARGQ